MEHTILAKNNEKFGQKWVKMNTQKMDQTKNPSLTWKRIANFG